MILVLCGLLLGGIAQTVSAQATGGHTGAGQQTGETPRRTTVSAGNAHSLVLKSDGTVVAFGANWSGQSDVPSGLSNVIAVAAGDSHSLALKADGTVVAWGANDKGQTNVPAGLNNVTAISAGGLHNLALKSDGTLPRRVRLRQSVESRCDAVV